MKALLVLSLITSVAIAAEREVNASLDFNQVTNVVTLQSEKKLVF
ncbi:hypothetical protein [Marinicellulosiphila megalodicopiae]